MGKNIIINTDFQDVIAKLGFAMEDDCLFLTDNKRLPPDPQIQFHIEKANELSASAVYLRRQLNGSYKPQVYLFDCTDRSFEEERENEIAEIQTKIWSSGEAPLACFFYNTAIKIVDCTKHITTDYKPEYLIKDLKLVGKADKLYNDQFAIKIKSGIFWEQEELKNKFKFQNSAYDALIKNIHNVSQSLKKELRDASISIINKIIVQAILIKYLEERIDSEGNKLLSEKYFKKYNDASTFNDVLKQKGKFVQLLNDLNNPESGFNGNVFKWETEEQNQLKTLDLSKLAKLLDTDKVDLISPQKEINFSDWRYFEFKLIPVELISRLYEEFLGEDKQEKGLYYTPSHLVKLLVDECIPLKKYSEIDPENFSILDPACGSGIFLVVAFKRLVQIWRLRNNKKPSINILKSILRNIYGVDKEEQAVRLASFSLSLALCNELNPVKILNDLRFDDLTEENLIHSDFFECKSIENKKFDLVIGNPPYVRGGTKKSKNNTTSIDNINVDVPNNQIALKFLGDSYSNLKKDGLQCLLVKSSSLLYNSTSLCFRKTLFSITNVVQIFDFTALAEGKSLWDNGARVGAAAIFIKKAEPDYAKNILHLTFRWTRATKERIVFEIDDYDLHFVNRQVAINNPYIWKNNLLGGGRIKATVDKFSSIGKLKDIYEIGIYGEGEGGAQSLPNNAFEPDSINELYLTSEYFDSFGDKQNKEVYDSPNFLIKENINLPFAINSKRIKFSNEVVGFHSTDLGLLHKIANYFKVNHEILKFFNIATSGKMLIYKDTACKQEDILNLPVDLNFDPGILISNFDKNIISDVNNYFQYYLRNRGNSKAIKPIKGNQNIQLIIGEYGVEFSRALNVIYENTERKFRLSDVIQLENSLIAAVFKYDNEITEPNFLKDLSELNIDGLTNKQISAHLSVNRIIKLYPQKDTIVFIKPNQYRYWLSLAAYRDADKCFSDFSNLIDR